MSEINRGLDHMANLQRGWSPGQAMLPPDPGGLNRALDRVAAEHLREVAPHLVGSPRDWPEDRTHENGNYECVCGACGLAFIGHKRRVTCRVCAVPPDGPHLSARCTDLPPSHRSCADILPTTPPAPPQPEPLLIEATFCARCGAATYLGCKCAPASPAEAPPKGSKAWAVQEACRIVGIAFHGIAEYDEASDCFCSESPHQDYRNGGHALAFVEQAVREKLAREKAPAPEAAGEMSREEFEAAVSDLEYTARVVGARICAGYPGAGRERLQIARSIETRLIAAHDHLRASRDEERARADMYSDLHAKECQDGAQRLSAALRERDEAREQREDLANEILAERSDLAAAEAEVKRLRSAYDDPTTDATDGAHPAWWRGSDAGVAGAVRIVTEALDEPLPLVGCVGGADLESVRQRVAALRARAQRLVEAGDAMASGNLGLADMRARWAAAKADVPAKGAKP